MMMMMQESGLEVRHIINWIKNIFVAMSCSSMGYKKRGDYAGKYAGEYADFRASCRWEISAALRTRKDAS